MPERVVALGASNLTRGFQTVVSASRAAWGPGVEVLAALGHGRSYGAPSMFLARRLPGILQSRIWECLERCQPASTRALVTDVGNDILYGFTAEQVLAWVEEAVDRLRRVTSDIVLTGLPLAGIGRVSHLKYLAFRSLVVPGCRLPLAEVAQTAERVELGLKSLASARDLRFLPLKEEWYGFDPIHIRPSRWRTAWLEILAGGAPEMFAAESSWREGARLYLMRPERQWLFGREQVTPQRGAALPKGGRVWLF